MGTIPQQFAMSTDIKIIIYHIHLPMTVEIVKKQKKEIFYDHCFIINTIAQWCRR